MYTQAENDHIFIIPHLINDDIFQNYHNFPTAAALSNKAFHSAMPDPKSITPNCSLRGEGSKCNIVVQHASSGRQETLLLEVDLIYIGPRTSKVNLLHAAGQKTTGSKADILGNNSLAILLARKGQAASNRHARGGLLRGGDAAEVEALQGEVGDLGGSGLKGRDLVEAGGQDVLDGDVGLGLGSDADGGEGDVDDVEVVPGEAFVGADGLEGGDGDGDGDVVELVRCY